MYWQFGGFKAGLVPSISPASHSGSEPPRPTCLPPPSGRPCSFWKALSSRSSSLIHPLTTSIHQRQLKYENTSGELHYNSGQASSSHHETYSASFLSLWYVICGEKKSPSFFFFPVFLSLFCLFAASYILPPFRLLFLYSPSLCFSSLGAFIRARSLKASITVSANDKIMVCL